MISGGKINNGYAIVTPNVTFFRHAHVTFVLESNVIVTKMFHFCLALGVTSAWLWNVYSLRWRDVLQTSRFLRDHTEFITFASYYKKYENVTSTVCHIFITFSVTSHFFYSTVTSLLMQINRHARNFILFTIKVLQTSVLVQPPVLSDPKENRPHPFSGVRQSDRMSTTTWQTIHETNPLEYPLEMNFIAWMGQRDSRISLFVVSRIWRYFKQTAQTLKNNTWRIRSWKTKRPCTVPALSLIALGDVWVACVHLAEEFEAIFSYLNSNLSNFIGLAILRTKKSVNVVILNRKHHLGC
jgi:hypothetical protein